jgi:hypothetical protein
MINGLLIGMVFLLGFLIGLTTTGFVFSRQFQKVINRIDDKIEDWKFTRKMKRKTEEDKKLINKYVETMRGK